MRARLRPAADRWRLLALAMPAFLGGCAAMFFEGPGADALYWKGTSTATPQAVGGQDCSALVFDLFSRQAQVGGRAFPAQPGTPDTPFGDLTGRFVSGEINANGEVTIMLREQGPWIAERYPASIWRGPLMDDRTIRLQEQPPSCGRELTLARDD